MSNISRRYTQDMLNICQGYAQATRIYPIYAQDLPKICSRNALDIPWLQDIPKICPWYAQVMPKIYPRHTQDMPWICPRYAQDVHKISQRFFFFSRVIIASIEGDHSPSQVFIASWSTLFMHEILWMKMIIAMNCCCSCMIFWIMAMKDCWSWMIGTDRVSYHDPYFEWSVV